ncbi:recombinase, partial [Clostridioides difficile]|nr:recombinase [Clostridioides difficile]
MNNDKKIIKVHNKSDKPDNIVIKENELIEKCLLLENKLPVFMKDYFIYLKGSVAVSTRLAYLEDINFFCSYLIETKELTNADCVKDITEDDFNTIK